MMSGSSFNASECKLLLEWCISRIEVHRWEQTTAVRRAEKKVAELLQGCLQEPLATVQLVDFILSEKATMAAYEKIESFCELLCGRLSDVEANKECPSDLKEAIASIIFAAPRCSDIPELQQVKILFTAKYGEEFAATAAEVHLGSGVNSIVLEKLSIRAPSEEIEHQILRDIAAEHNIVWPDTFNSERPYVEQRQNISNVRGFAPELYKRERNPSMAAHRVHAPNPRPHYSLHFSLLPVASLADFWDAMWMREPGNRAKNRLYELKSPSDKLHRLETLAFWRLLKRAATKLEHTRPLEDRSEEAIIHDIKEHLSGRKHGCLSNEHCSIECNLRSYLDWPEGVPLHDPDSFRKLGYPGKELRENFVRAVCLQEEQQAEDNEPSLMTSPASSIWGLSAVGDHGLSSRSSSGKRLVEVPPTPRSWHVSPVGSITSLSNSGSPMDMSKVEHERGASPNVPNERSLYDRTQGRSRNWINDTLVSRLYDMVAPKR